MLGCAAEWTFSSVSRVIPTISSPASACLSSSDRSVMFSLKMCSNERAGGRGLLRSKQNDYTYSISSNSLGNLSNLKSLRESSRHAVWKANTSPVMERDGFHPSDHKNVWLRFYHHGGKESKLQDLFPFSNSTKQALASFNSRRG